MRLRGLAPLVHSVAHAYILVRRFFPLAHNFLETLSAVTETCVALLHLDADAAVMRRANRRRRAQTDDELARLDLLRDRIDAELATALAGDGHDAVSAVAARLSNELERAYAGARGAIARRPTTAPPPTDDAAALLRLLERLLIAHDLPDTRWELQWRTPCGDEPPRAVAACSTGFGVDAQLALAVPDDHALAEPVRLGQPTASRGRPISSPPRCGGSSFLCARRPIRRDGANLPGIAAGGTVISCRLRPPRSRCAPCA